MKDGYFTFKLRDVDTSAFVGNGATISPQTANVGASN